MINTKWVVFIGVARIFVVEGVLSIVTSMVMTFLVIVVIHLPALSQPN